MLSTKNLVDDYTKVPTSFIFEYYCNLKEKLIGQEVKIKSLFNEKDNDPSMSIYVHTSIDKQTNKEINIYKFKDFSSGLGGSGINLVMELKGLNFNQAALQIVNDYNTYKLKNPNEEPSFKEQAKYKIVDSKTRKWNTLDQDFWTDFNIGSEFLDEYNIKPLSQYTLSKEDGLTKDLVIKGQYIYGFFTNTGELYKIYQPKNKERKYIKIKSYIQGTDQLKGYDTLIINSGIKDIGAFKSLKLKVDNIAPDSENVIILKETIEHYKKEYKYIFVMFDNDEAGIKAMKRYRQEYSIPCILLTVEKDLAEAVKLKGPRDIRQRVVSLIELKTFKL